MDPKSNKEFASKKNIKYWNPVDWYNGGMEHTTLHLLYSRFWHKFLYDIKLVPTKEPYKKRTSHGLILAGDGDKMSKSKGNVVNPDELVKIWGADSLRLYEMFMGPFDQGLAWNTDNMIGVRRFLEKIWKLQDKIELRGTSNESRKINKSKLLTPNPKLESLVHQTIKKVSEDIEGMKFNTAISTMMILVNEMEKESVLSKQNFGILLQLLAPFAPHIAEELWVSLGNKKSIHVTSWPKFDAKKIVKTEVNIAIQVNGKVRGVLSVDSGVMEEVVKAQALKMPEIKKWLDGKEIKKVVFVLNKVLNIVI
jgi:leucyl-tRNA synthetase